MIILNRMSAVIHFGFIMLMPLLFMNIIRYSTGSEYKTTAVAPIAPSLFVNHGGGPLPILGDKDHEQLTKFLGDEVKKYIELDKVKAIIVITAHWEENIVTISSGQHHKLYFDYYHFPPESYEFKYDAPGDPELAERIHEALKKAGVNSQLDSKRGWDHGTFIPMMLINPAANVPIIQISILSNQDAEQHYNLGQALHQFRKEGIAILGSGMSYHNMKELKHCPYTGVINQEFDDFLNRVCTAEDEIARIQGLLSWRDQPGGTESHPINGADHLMPLIVVAGAGGPKPGERVFNLDFCGTFKLSGFIWKYL